MFVSSSPYLSIAILEQETIDMFRNVYTYYMVISPKIDSSRLGTPGAAGGGAIQ